MNDSTSPSRASAAEMAATRERSARAEFARQFTPEPAGVSAQERELRKAAHDLSPTAIWVALMAAGVDPDAGLGGVPSSKVAAATACLRSSFRTQLTT